LSTKAQVKEINTTTEASNFENKLKDIDDAEHFVINGEKVDKKQLVEKYILVQEFQYDEN
jgi:hypothetical protein